MTDRLARLLENERMIFTLVAVLALAGIAAYLSMIRQEDPAFPYRSGIVTVAFPGADPGRIERLVLDPVEEELAQVEEIDWTESTARQGVALVRVRLQPHVYATQDAWDRVRIALDKATEDFPDGVAEPVLDDRVVTASTAVLAVTGSDDPLELADAAERLKAHLLDLNGVSTIELVGDPGEQITVAFSDAALFRTGLTPDQIIGQLQSSNQIISGGSLELEGRSLVLRPMSDYASVDEIRRTPIALPGGEILPLSTLASIHRNAAQPPEARTWFDGRRAVSLEIKTERNATNVVAFGKRMRAAVEELRADFEPLEIREQFYQPAYTEERLSNLTGNLFVAVLIIVAVLFVGMGIRVGLLVATILPLVTLSALAVYAMGGGVLHQMAIIGMVIALGILVDNAIVMTENIQHHLNLGATPVQAATRSVRELAGPLFSATGTTLAAFVPMVLSSGNTADFIRAMPILIMLALSISYIYAVTLTPVLGRRFLKPQSREREESAPVMRLADRLGRLSTGHPWLLVIVGGVLITGSFAAGSLLDREFFPNADRAQVIIDLSLPEGTYLETTQQVTRQMEQALRGRDNVNVVHTFVGFSGPPFYYNLQINPDAPQRARLVAETESLEANRDVIDWVHDYSRRELPGVQVVPAILRQGPPVEAPIEVRVFNPDPLKLAEAAEQVFAAVLSVPGSRDVRHDLGAGAPSVVYRVHDDVARRLGVTRVDIAQALLGRSQGVTIGQYRAGEDPVPIRLRSPEGQYFPLAELETVNVYGENGASVPLVQVADAVLEMQPGAIEHHNQHRVARVFSELGEGYVFSEVLIPVRETLEEIELPPGTRIEFGGEAQASSEANAALLQAAPPGVALLLFFLLLEFNSFRRLGLVLLTIPFAVAGVIPGLLLLGIPFGFQPMQGIIALVGIVVNNAIVLIDVIDHRLAEGRHITEAVADAVRRRTRPILLTTATTIAGLLPLALSDTTLWPPMAWTIITGLLASTLLTLLMMPALCTMLLGKRPPRKPRAATATIALAAVGLALAASVTPTPATADDDPTVDFATAVRSGIGRPRVREQGFTARAAGEAAKATQREAFFPKLEVSAFAARTDEVGSFQVPTPAGPQTFETGEREQRGATIELRQPLLNPAGQLFGTPAAKRQARAEVASTDSAKLSGAIGAAQAYLDALRLKARLASNQRLLESLRARAERISDLAANGRALRADRLEVEFAVQRAEQDGVRLREGYRAARAQLARAMGRRGRVAPAQLDYAPTPVTRGIDALMEEALVERRDLDALELAVEAADLQVKAAGAQWLPRLDAVASLQFVEGNTFAPEREGRIEAQLVWTPFAGGAIAARRGEARERMHAADARRMEMLHTIRVQIERFLADLESAKALAELAEKGIESARATLEARSARFDAGRATIDDVLDAEAELAEQQTLAAVARYDALDAWVRLQGALGNGDWVRELPETGDRGRADMAQR